MKQLLVAALLLAPTTLAGQYPRLTGRVPQPLVSAVVPLLDSARAAGLPTDLLEAKVLEGVTKGANADVIANAVRRLATDLGTARRLLGGGASAREIAAGAGALRAGFSGADLERIHAARSARDAAVAFEVATDLVASTVPVDTAARVVLRALTSGASDEQLAQLRMAVERDVANGVPAPVAASLRATLLFKN